jgi:hypothetical protein
MQRVQNGAQDGDEEPLYVNAKQYHRILKRRQARARLEASGKIPRIRKVGFVICFKENLPKTQVLKCVNPDIGLNQT